jgi:hypothetical protein
MINSSRYVSLCLLKDFYNQGLNCFTILLEDGNTNLKKKNTGGRFVLWIMPASNPFQTLSRQLKFSVPVSCPCIYIYQHTALYCSHAFMITYVYVWQYNAQASTMCIVYSCIHSICIYGCTSEAMSTLNFKNDFCSLSFLLSSVHILFMCIVYKSKLAYVKGTGLQ